MRPWRIALIALLVSTALLAGCLGGDDDPDTGSETNDGGSEDLGSIAGRILTVDLEQIANANVALVDGSDLIADTRTDEEGKYSIASIEPGEYRLQASAACCRESVQGVTINAGEETSIDLQLDRFTEADLQQPFVEEHEWEGFMACGVGSPVVVASPCGDVDENDDFLLNWELKAGVQEVVIGVSWDASGGVMGEEFYVAMEIAGCGAGCSSANTYGSGEGPSPLLFNAPNPGGDNDYNDIEDTAAVQFRVFPAFAPDVYYQQPFTVHYHVFYHEGAPEGYDPIPDL